ncbi:hypothetical protein [Streptomyces iconiensis]|uniref:Uncharacterized protein n=1 Tax=Streptomyces iconiensis TaxID=1384038 RepID=A0ABT7A158_9ACTN|nr:hypothetical protein [Streptomyces iconiensis]MDJ1134799.1 hypothetical protein [Streptomyces iconiensis]
MTDPYRSFAAPEARRPERTETSQAGMARPVLWLLLLVSAVLNAVTSSIGGISVFVGIGMGLATLAFAAALVVHYRRRRRA